MASIVKAWVSRKGATVDLEAAPGVHCNRAGMAGELAAFLPFWQADWIPGGSAAVDGARENLIAQAGREAWFTEKPANRLADAALDLRRLAHPLHLVLHLVAATE